MSHIPFAFARFLRLLLRLFSALSLAAVAQTIPPTPTEPILDSAGVLTKVSRERLNEVLSREARESNIHIFVLTLRSNDRKGLPKYAERVAEAWVKGQFGAVLVFEDLEGKVTIQASDVIVTRFGEWQLKVLLKPEMAEAEREKLSRARLERATIGVASAIKIFKIRADHEDRQIRYERIGAALLIILGLALGALHVTKLKREDSEANGVPKFDP